MLKEAIDRIAELGTAASGIEVVSLHHRTKLIREGSNFREVEIGPEPRCDTVESVDDMGLLIEKVGTNAIAYVGTTKIIAVLDADKRDDRVIMPLEKSPAICALLELSSGVTQKQLIQSLREPLADCCEPKFLAIIRRLDFSRKSDGRSDVQHGRESLGRSVEAAIQSSEGDIPETVAFELPWLTSRDLPTLMTIKCAVSMDVVNERIALRPVGDCLESEIFRVRQQIAGRIADAVDVPVVLGEPG